MGVRALFQRFVKVATERICYGCLQPFKGEGYVAVGRRYCTETCCPTVIRAAVAMRKWEREAEEREARLRAAARA